MLKNTKCLRFSCYPHSEQAIGNTRMKPLKDYQTVVLLAFVKVELQDPLQFFATVRHSIDIQAAHKHGELQTNAEVFHTLVNLAAKFVARYVVAN
jgi:hypothetical protein